MRRRRQGWQLRRTRLVFCASLVFLLGVAAAHSGWALGWQWPLLAGLMTIFSWRRRTLWTLGWLVLFAVSLGWCRGAVYMQHLADYQPYFGHKITIIATASNDATYNSHKQLNFDAHDALVQGTGQRLTGKVNLSGFGSNMIFAGDRVAVSGKLRPGYGSYQAKLSYGQVSILARGHSLVAELRRNFQAGIQSALPEPLASFGMGLLIGQKATLPDSVYQSLLMVGLVHIIAVSGYNLTIILRATNGLLRNHSKRLSTLLALGLIGLFLLVAGSSASIVRAAIISVLAIAADYYGRQIKPLNLLLLAAAITAWLNPYYIWTDVSWYLSFLAFFGVLVVAPMLAQRLPARISNSLIGSVALESLCAELMTLPYVLYVFGQMSFIGIIANLLVVAFTPLAMLLCLIAGLAGMLLSAYAGWFAWPARLLLTYMLDVAGLLSTIPNIFKQGWYISLQQLAVLYGAVIVLVLTLWHKVTKSPTVRASGLQNNHSFAIITDKNEG